MKLSIKMQKDLDRVVEIRNSDEKTLVQTEQDIALLVKNNNFSELIKKFQLQASVSDSISSIAVSDSSEMSFKSAIKMASLELCNDFLYLMLFNPEDITEEMVDSIIRTDGRDGAALRGAIEQYIDSKTHLEEYGINFQYATLNDPGHVKTDHIYSKSSKLAPVHVDITFDPNAVEQWLVNHTLVQDGHLVFVE